MRDTDATMCSGARLRMGFAVALLLAAAARGVWAESIPPPKITDLLKADYVAVGRFVIENEAVRFVTSKALWGDPGAVDAMKKRGPRVEVNERGGLTAWIWGANASWGGGESRDATQPALWFFFKWGELGAQRAEWAPDITLLRQGNTPSAQFRLLQQLDFDMRRAALEELFVGRDARTIESLHRAALGPDTSEAWDAVELLIQARLLDLDRFWGRWMHCAAKGKLHKLLLKRDGVRVAREMRKALTAEKRPDFLASLLYLTSRDVKLNLQYLDHPAEVVRRRALSSLWGAFYAFARSPGQKARAEALARRVLPLLSARRKVETSVGIRKMLDTMLEEVNGVPWVLRVPIAKNPPPTYSDAAERNSVINHLIKGASPLIMESAGREIAEYYLDYGFAQLKAAAREPGANKKKIYAGMGYLRDPRVFAHLVERAKDPEVSDATFATLLLAIGRQNQQESFDVLQERFASRVKTSRGPTSKAVCDALAVIRHPRALSFLKSLDGAVPRRRLTRALAAHGDPAAVRELLPTLSAKIDPRFPAMWHSLGSFKSLIQVDAQEVDKALKKHVRKRWPTSWRTRGWVWDLDWFEKMDNRAGAERRSSALGEVARRDPRWLGDFALKQMASPFLMARLNGVYVFRSLTGRWLEFQPAAFESERAAPLNALRAWWAKHRAESREQWLLSYFRSKGFAMARLHYKKSLPVLVRALSADRFTHSLAVEQISIITGKYFGRFTQPNLRQTVPYPVQTPSDLTAMTVRVTGWLTARKLLTK